MMPFIGDEALRCLVAMEMDFQNNYLVPTTNGEFYFSKPPLYNWILLLFFKIYGSVDEWIARVPTVLFTLSFTFIIYRYYHKVYKDKKNAIIVALMFLTCGRIMFWDSFLALIDIFFSMLMFLLFMVIYKYGRSHNYKSLYFFAYLITFLGFMLKGFPAPVFLGITLGTYILLYKDWSILFKWTHVISFLFFGSLIAIYFYFYNQYLDASQTVAPLLEQATKRTILKYPILDVLKHIITYPFENIYHFLPWSTLILTVLRLDFFKLLNENDFIRFTFWCFIANLSIYWISPEVFPRYVLMLTPLIFGVFLYFYEHENEDKTWQKKAVDLLFSTVAAVLPFAILAAMLSSKIEFIPYAKFKIGMVAMSMMITSYFYFKNKNYRLFYIVILVLLLRIFFNLIIMPSRSASGQYATVKKESIALAKKYEPLHVFKDTRFYFNNLYYITKTKNKLFDKKRTFEKGHYYVIDSTNYAEKYKDSTIKLDSVTDGEFHKNIYIIQLR
jgi:4-amino-4-deoxy-L-arabinose transferase-like glycosyltransferase